MSASNNYPRKKSWTGGCAVGENKGTEGRHFIEKNVTENISSLLFPIKNLVSSI